MFRFLATSFSLPMVEDCINWLSYLVGQGYEALAGESSLIILIVEICSRVMYFRTIVCKAGEEGVGWFMGADEALFWF